MKTVRDAEKNVGGLVFFLCLKRPGVIAGFANMPAQRGATGAKWCIIEAFAVKPFAVKPRTEISNPGKATL